VLRVLLLLLTALILSCSRPPPDATPEGALREWLDRMDASITDPKKAKDAYALLDKTTQDKLSKRAERSSRIEGHRVEPYEVLAEGRFALRFRLKHVTTAISGNTAIVSVTGDEPMDVANIKCVKEGTVWRVALELPELMELPHRVESP
jgi:hypothetical protein